MPYYKSRKRKYKKRRWSHRAKYLGHLPKQKSVVVRHTIVGNEHHTLAPLNSLIASAFELNNFKETGINAAGSTNRKPAAWTELKSMFSKFQILSCKIKVYAAYTTTPVRIAGAPGEATKNMGVVGIYKEQSGVGNYATAPSAMADPGCSYAILLPEKLSIIKNSCVPHRFAGIDAHDQTLQANVNLSSFTGTRLKWHVFTANAQEGKAATQEVTMMIRFDYIVLWSVPIKQALE